MLHAGVHEVVYEVFVNFIYTALDGPYDASAAYHGVEGAHVDATLGEGGLYEVLAPVELIGHLLESRQFVGSMVDGECVVGTVVGEDRDFCRGRPGIYGKNFKRHGL